MGLARSTYYDEPDSQSIKEARLVERIKEICTEWPSYGYRRVTAELQAAGSRVNHKKVMRLMKEHGLSQAIGMARSTINRGLAEIEQNRSAGAGRVRRPGGGRKPKAEQDPTLLTSP